MDLIYSYGAIHTKRFEERVVKRVGKKEANLQESDFLYVNGRRFRGRQVGRLTLGE